MKKILVIIFLISLVFFRGCIYVYEENGRFIGSNPTSYVFNVNINDLNEAIKDSLEIEDPTSYSIEHQFPLKPYKNFFHIFISKTPSHDNLFNNIGDDDDVFLTVKTWLSDIYRINGKPALIEGAFHIKLDYLDVDKTRMTVNVLDMNYVVPTIIPSMHGSVVYRKKIKSSSIEEYSFIYHVGKYLGFSMPEINRPKDFRYLN